MRSTRLYPFSESEEGPMRNGSAEWRQPRDPRPPTWVIARALPMWPRGATFHHMITVGIRELKNKLSAYIRRARAGEVVLVTDRGEVVAELRAPTVPDGPTPYPDLNRQIGDGLIREAIADPPSDLYSVGADPLPISEPDLLRLLDEDRGEH